MAKWDVITLPDDRNGQRAWQTTLIGGDGESDVKIIAGDVASVSVDGGPVAVYGALLDGEPCRVLRNLIGDPLKPLRNCLEPIAGPVYAVKVTGVGVVTLYATRRG
jgi:hypothetical protein